MADRSTITMLGNVAGLPLAARPLSSPAAAPVPLPPPPPGDSVQWSRAAERHLQGANLSANGVARMNAVRQSNQQPSLSFDRGSANAELGADAGFRLDGHHAGPQASADGRAMADAAMMIRANASGTLFMAPSLKVAQGQLLAEAASRIRSNAAARLDTRSGVSLSGTMAGEAEAVAHASAQGSIISAPMRLSAEAKLLSEAVARMRAGATGRAELGHDLVVQGSATAEGEIVTRALAHGSALFSPTMVDAQGILLTEALTRTTTDVSGHVEASKALVVDAGMSNVNMVGTQSIASGAFRFGVDRDGLPSFRIGALSEATAGASAKAMAHGQVSLLGLITVGASGETEALAGLAGGMSGDITLQDRSITISTGARAAMGVGGGAAGSITVGLGKLPAGIIKTVVGPVIALPTLLISSVMHGVNRLTGNSDPSKDAPGITDYPDAVVSNVKGGLQMISEGAKETVDEIGDVGAAIGHGVEAIVDGIADAGSSLWDGLKDLVK